jgi:hypothetical protein
LGIELTDEAHFDAPLRFDHVADDPNEIDKRCVARLLNSYAPENHRQVEIVELHVQAALHYAVALTCLISVE